MNLSVSSKLLIVMLAVLTFGILGVIGVVQINRAATLHQLNFRHIKYNHIFSERVLQQDISADSLERLKQDLRLIRAQPVGCLAVMGIFERALMDALGTSEAVTLCANDITLADETLKTIDEFRQGNLSPIELINVLQSSHEEFQRNSETFEPLVNKTVQFVFLFVLYSLIVGAVLMTLFIFYLARSIRRDYRKIRETESALSASESFLSTVGNIAEVGGWEFDPRTGDLNWTNETYRIFGLDPSAELSLEIAESFFIPQDRDSVIEAFRITIENRGSVDLEANLEKTNGELITVHIIGNVKVESGRVVKLHGAIQNITRRKQAEQAAREGEFLLKDVLRNTTSGIIMSDSDGVIFQFNQAAGKIFGYNEVEIRGQNVSVLMPEHESRQHHRYLTGYLNTGNSKIIGKGRELTGLRKDGEKFPMHLGLGEINRSGSTWFVASIEDLTERTMLEDQLRHSQKMKAVGELTGGVAHDFNNILAVIHGNLGLLEDDLSTLEGGAGLRKYLRPAIDATERASVLTHRLLAFARKQVLLPELLDLNSVLDGMKNLLKRTLGEEIDLKWNLGAGQMQVEVDASQLENAVINLSVNARDAMPEGGILTISTEPISMSVVNSRFHPQLEQGDYLVLKVSDTGIGMDEHVAEQSMEPFFTTKELGKGTGLGLSMVYGFAGQSGGNVAMESKLAIGTTVSLYLPRCAAGYLANPKEQVIEPSGGSETILLVEDEAPVRDVTARMLKRLGYKVIEADDGDSAFKLANHEAVDLLITDVRLPGGMNGFEIAKQIHDDHREIRILYITGHIDNIEGQSLPLNASTNLLHKPFGYHSLAVKVRSVLDADTV